MNFFACKISDPNSKIVEEITLNNDFIVDQLNQLENILKIGDKVFIQLSGDKVKWEKGLIGIAEIIKEPFEKGYDEKNIRNFKLGLKINVLLKKVIKREEFIHYLDAFDAAGIGPNTKGEQNQAIKKLEEKQAIAILRVMAEKETELKNIFETILDKEITEKIFGKMTRLIEKEMTFSEVITEYKTENTNSLYKINANIRKRFKHPLNLIIYGPPGTGKTYSTVEHSLAIIENRELNFKKVDENERKKEMQKYNNYIINGQIVFITFHQSYDYSDFIQGIQPNLNNGNVSFQLVDGIFKKIADKAINNLDKDFVIIIDEINRGNISKIFGELISLIEEDKRWGEINQTSSFLPLGGQFAVPNNLYIIGTMNSADKSISLVDIALRRRFYFLEQVPDDKLIYDPLLKLFFKEINLVLSEKLESTDLLIGHSYFIDKNFDDLVTILNSKIIPLLYEYFYDQRNSIRDVLQQVIDNIPIPIEIILNPLGRIKVARKQDY